jgi:AcrR family transcriptional regulator
MFESQRIEISRRMPSQARSAQTVELILDAAIQILERQGEKAVTTNSVAQRAGFSVGSLYQYFANRDEILIALADREQRRIAEHMRGLIGQIEFGNGLDSARAFIKTLVRSIKHRRGAKRYSALIATLRERGAMPALGDEFAAVLEETWTRLGDSRGPLITKIHAYVLTHAVLGVLRDAILSDSVLMEAPEFEEALFRLVIAFSRDAPTSHAQPPDT